MLFLVSQKVPDYYSVQIFPFFVRPQSSPCMYHFLVQTLIGFRGNAAVTGSSPCFSQKLFRAFAKLGVSEGFLCRFFFGTVRFFCGMFLSTKVPLRFFFIFCNKLEFQKAPRVSFLPLLALWDCFKFLTFRLKMSIPTNIFFSRLSEYLTLYPNYIAFCSGGGRCSKTEVFHEIF